MQLVLQATGGLLHMLVSKTQSHLSSLAMLNNKATNAKLDSTNYLATQTNQCD